jgi:hypothetical protein
MHGFSACRIRTSSLPSPPLQSVRTTPALRSPQPLRPRPIPHPTPRPAHRYVERHLQHRCYDHHTKAGSAHIDCCVHLDLDHRGSRWRNHRVNCHEQAILGQHHDTGIFRYGSWINHQDCERLGRAGTSGNLGRVGLTVSHRCGCGRVPGRSGGFRGVATKTR